MLKVLPRTISYHPAVKYKRVNIQWARWWKKQWRQRPFVLSGPSRRHRTAHGKSSSPTHLNLYAGRNHESNKSFLTSEVTNPKFCVVIYIRVLLNILAVFVNSTSLLLSGHSLEFLYTKCLKRHSMDFTNKVGNTFSSQFFLYTF